MMYRTSMYAVHEYQTSEAEAMIEQQILEDYDAFLFPFILSHSLHFVPLSSKPVLCR